MANILLVDDDGSVLLTLAIALRRYGHSVTVACDANQALLHLKQHHFSYLVSDVRMPGMSGIELAMKARRLADPPRVILTSAYSNIQVRDGIVDAFLQKPIDTEHLNRLLSADLPAPGTGTPATGVQKIVSHAVSSMAGTTSEKRGEARRDETHREESHREGPRSEESLREAAANVARAATSLSAGPFKMQATAS